jgi:hypothetical protein
MPRKHQIFGDLQLDVSKQPLVVSEDDAAHVVGITPHPHVEHGTSHEAAIRLGDLDHSGVGRSFAATREGTFEIGGQISEVARHGGAIGFGAVSDGSYGCGMPGLAPPILPWPVMISTTESSHVMYPPRE